MNQLCAILALGAFGSLASSCVSSRAHYVPTSSAAERHGPAHDRRTVRTEEPESYDGRVEIVHFTLGEFELRDEAFWEPLDQPFSLGLDYSSTSTEDGLGAELGFQFWGDSTGGSFGDLDLSGVELAAGMRSTW
ncbi:MAG TPA: hypothetical protein P5218_14840, partial [Planctomycetota bacterium]|nr:hypothetical protein [Planctomycetota bacterium]